MTSLSKKSLWRRSSPWTGLRNVLKVRKLWSVSVTAVAYQLGIGISDDSYLSVTWAKTVPDAKGYVLRLVDARLPNNVVADFPVTYVEGGENTQTRIAIAPGILSGGTYKIQIKAKGDNRQYIDSDWSVSQQTVTQLYKPSINLRNVYESRDAYGGEWRGIELIFLNPDYRYGLLIHIPGRSPSRYFLNPGQMYDPPPSTFHIDHLPAPRTWDISLIKIESRRPVRPDSPRNTISSMRTASIVDELGDSDSGPISRANHYKFCTVIYLYEIYKYHSIKILFDHDLSYLRYY